MRISDLLLMKRILEDAMPPIVLKEESKKVWKCSRDRIILMIRAELERKANAYLREKLRKRIRRQREREEK